MSSGTFSQMLRRLRGCAGPETVRQLSDAALLERYVARRDEAAFQMLVGRHGPMVFGVCRRLLRQDADAEDAFQATFLVLVRMADAIGKRGSVAAWLHRVALRLALAVRADTARRSRGRRLDIDLAQVPSADGVAPDGTLADGATPDCDLRRVLDEELNRLPEKYRLPVILCYLQGKTCEETAAELGCPKGTVTVRLMRAKARLRGRLARRLGISGGVIVAAVLEQAAAAAPPAGLAQAAVASALQFSVSMTSTTAAAGVLATRAADLAQGVLRAMFLTKIKNTVLIVLLAALLTAGFFNVAPHLFPSRATAGNAALEEGRQKQAAALPKQPPKNDQQLILGKWQAVSAMDGGRVVPPQALKGSGMEFTKDKAFFIKSATEKEEMTYQLDPRKAPKWIDFTKKGKPPQPAIYELKGDTLKIVIDETAEKGRPTDFVSEPGTVNDLLMIFQRIAEPKNSPRSIAVKFVTTLLVDYDPPAAVSLVDADAERANNGRGSLAASLKKLKPDSLQRDGQLKKIIFFTKDEIAGLAQTYPDRMWDRFAQRLEDGLGCLAVIDTGRPNRVGLIGFVIRTVNGENRIVYCDDN